MPITLPAVRWRPRRAPYSGQINHLPFDKQLTGNLTANATNQLLVAIPIHPSVLDPIVRVATITVPADADGTLLATLRRWDASAAAFVDLSAALDLEALVTKVGAKFTLLSNVDMFFDEGDTLLVDIVNNSAAINTQPVGLTISGAFFGVYESR